MNLNIKFRLKVEKITKFFIYALDVLGPDKVLGRHGNVIFPDIFIELLFTVLIEKYMYIYIFLTWG